MNHGFHTLTWRAPVYPSERTIGYSEFLFSPQIHALVYTFKYLNPRISDSRFQHGRKLQDD